MNKHKMKISFNVNRMFENMKTCESKTKIASKYLPWLWPLCVCVRAWHCFWSFLMLKQMRWTFFIISNEIGTRCEMHHTLYLYTYSLHLNESAFIFTSKRINVPHQVNKKFPTTKWICIVTHQLDVWRRHHITLFWNV